MSQHADTVRTIISDQLGVANTDDTTSLVNAIAQDELGLITLVMELEETFNIEIDDGEAESLKTVGDVIAMVDAKTGA